MGTRDEHEVVAIVQQVETWASRRSPTSPWSTNACEARAAVWLLWSREEARKTVTHVAATTRSQGAATTATCVTGVQSDGGTTRTGRRGHTTTYDSEGRTTKTSDLATATTKRLRFYQVAPSPCFPVSPDPAFLAPTLGENNAFLVQTCPHMTSCQHLGFSFLDGILVLK